MTIIVRIVSFDVVIQTREKMGVDITNSTKRDLWLRLWQMSKYKRQKIQKFTFE